VKSEMVVGPDRPGRTVTVIGEIPLSNKAERAARNADYLLTPVGQHSGHDKCISPTQALSLAKSASVKNPVFSRINTRYALIGPVYIERTIELRESWRK